MAVQITIRGVPEAVRDELAARAALQRQSMQAYLRSELERIASRPSFETWLREVRERVKHREPMFRLPLSCALVTRTGSDRRRGFVRTGRVPDRRRERGGMGAVSPRRRPSRRAGAGAGRGEQCPAPVGLAGEISRLEATSAHRDLLRLDLELVPFAPYAERVWALRGNLTCYDAWYVALAEALDCPLMTLDRRLGRASGPTCEITVPPWPEPEPMIHRTDAARQARCR